jgi:integrase
MKTTFRLKDKDARNETAVYVDIVHATIRTKFYTNISVPPKYWSQKDERIKVPLIAINTEPFLEDLQESVNLKLSDIDALIKKYPRHCLKNDLVESADGLKKHLETILQPSIEKQDFVFLVDYIERSYLPGCESGIITFMKHNQYMRYSAGTLKSKKGVLFALKEYEKTRPRIRFEKVDMDFYETFIKWSESKGHKINQTGKIIKEIKTVMRYAYEQGLHNNTSWDTKKFAILQEAVTSIYLTNNELIRLKALSLTGSEKHYRDFFLVGCYTALRVSDYKRITPEHIKQKDGFKVIEITTQKTKTKVMVPIAEEIQSILDDPNFYGRSLIEQKLNKKIKDLCKEAGITEMIEIVRNVKGLQSITKVEKYKLVSSHTGRRTGATNLFNIHKISKDVMQITGHKSERAFFNYIRTTTEDAAERLAPTILNTRRDQLKIVS